MSIPAGLMGPPSPPLLPGAAEVFRPLLGRAPSQVPCCEPRCAPVGAYAPLTLLSLCVVSCETVHPQMKCITRPDHGSPSRPFSGPCADGTAEGAMAVPPGSPCASELVCPLHGIRGRAPCATAQRARLTLSSLQGNPATAEAAAQKRHPAGGCAVQ